MASSANVRSWIETDEAASEAITRINTIIRPFISLPPPLHRIPLRPGNVLEIVGPTPSGKSHVLMQAAVECILPKEYGGMERLVMFVDLDCRFDILRLSQLLNYRLLAVQSQNSTGKKQCEEEKELFEICIKRFLYTRCYSSFEFLATLKTLNYQLHQKKHKQETGPLLFMIDSVGAFYWMDRGLPSLPLGANRKSLSLQTTSEIVVQEMRSLLLVHPMIVIATKTASLGQMHTTKVSRKKRNWCSDEVLPYHEYMPSVWRTLVTHRIFLQTSEDKKEHQNKLIYLAEWLLPSLSLMDKFVVSDGGVSIA